MPAREMWQRFNPIITHTSLPETFNPHPMAPVCPGLNAMVIGPSQ